MAKTSAKKIDLEKALGELETLVGELEGGDLSLETAMKKFERGVALTRDCQSALSSAEQKIAVLMQDAGLSDAPQPFESDED